MNLELKNIYVNFSHKVVLNDVNIFFQEGKIHALLGDNGAGKSTIANILSGELSPTSGEILINNTPICLKNSRKALQNKICYVHQKPMLAESISIKENLLLGLKDKSLIKEFAAFWLPNVSLSTLVENVGSDTKFFIALTSALLKKPDFLILDEPSVLLDDEQRSFLYTNLQQMAEKGMNILVITHNFEEAEKYCHKIFKLEDGKITDFLQQKEISLITGKTYSTGALQIDFNSLTSKPVNQPAIFDIHFSVKQGEIVLIKGLPEDGLLTLENLLCGYNKEYRKGNLQFIKEDKPVHNINLKTNKYSTRMLRKGLVLENGDVIHGGIIPTNKTYRGSNPFITISQMLTLQNPDLDPQELINLSEITISPEEKVSNLSGGMLQRLMLNRELSSNPELLILCQPLQGLDVYACENTCKKIQAAAEKGTMIIILSSSDFPADFCTRQYKLTAGKLERD